MKFPYGISDFYRVRAENYFYADRTHLLPLIESAGDQLLFLRPRRFGKSLLLSLLENYYDVAKASEFDRLFGDLAIGQQPTALHNRYFVMRWDFSMVETVGDSQRLRQHLHDHINARIANFLLDYRAWLGDAPDCLGVQIEPDLRRHARYAAASERQQALYRAVSEAH